MKNCVIIYIIKYKGLNIFMQLIGTICELSTPGRWGRANRTDVIVRDSFQIESGRSYLLMENPENRQQFLLTAKYDRDQIIDLEPMKMMMIVIGKQKDDVNAGFFTRNSDIKEFFYFAGDGAILIVDEELEKLRKNKEQGSGMVDQIQNLVKRFLGTGKS